MLLSLPVPYVFLCLHGPALQPHVLEFSSVDLFPMVLLFVSIRKVTDVGWWGLHLSCLMAEPPRMPVPCVLSHASFHHSLTWEERRAQSLVGVSPCLSVFVLQAPCAGLVADPCL